jgi:hypothetical protein
LRHRFNARSAKLTKFSHLTGVVRMPFTESRIIAGRRHRTVDRRRAGGGNEHVPASWSR